MAPTELLAEQHFETLANWFEPLGFHVGWLSGSVKGKARDKALAQLETNQPFLSGYHALFQSQVEFAQLGLVLIDEQHRFGVAQRHFEKGEDQIRPHQLIFRQRRFPRPCR